jgi:4-carboxymuconolactone decarboxylase
VSGSASDDRFERGLEVRKRVVGAENVERQLDGATELDRDFQRLVTEYCWGEVWTGTAPSAKQRSLHNLCLLAALNRPTEFETHCRGALRNGVTVDELRETLVQIAVYAGVPAGMEAFRIARRVLAEQE